MTAQYLSTKLGEEKIFATVEGGLVRELGLEQGITFDQWDDLYNGRWGDYQAKAGPRPLKEPDPDRPGKMRYRTDPVTGKRLTEPYHNPYTSMVVAAQKDWTLAILAMHKIDPEKAKAMRAGFEQANRVAAQAIERQVKFLRVPAHEAAEMMAAVGGSPTVVKATSEAKGSRRVPGSLIDFMETQDTARPTDVSLQREGQLSDPHLHCHHTIPNMGQFNGRWLTADSYDLFTARIYELVAQTVDAKTVRIWKDLGVPFEFSRNNRGRIEAKVVGISDDAIRACSTNHERTQEVAAQFAERDCCTDR